MRKKEEELSIRKKHHRKEGIPEEYRKKPDRTGKKPDNQTGHNRKKGTGSKPNCIRHKPKGKRY